MKHLKFALSTLAAIGSLALLSCGSESKEALKSGLSTDPVQEFQLGEAQSLTQNSLFLWPENVTDSSKTEVIVQMGRYSVVGEKLPGAEAKYAGLKAKCEQECQKKLDEYLAEYEPKFKAIDDQHFSKEMKRVEVCLTQGRDAPEAGQLKNEIAALEAGRKQLTLSVLSAQELTAPESALLKGLLELRFGILNLQNMKNEAGAFLTKKVSLYKKGLRELRIEPAAAPGAQPSIQIKGFAPNPFDANSTPTDFATPNTIRNVKYEAYGGKLSFVVVVSATEQVAFQIARNKYSVTKETGQVFYNGGMAYIQNGKKTEGMVSFSQAPQQ